MEETKDQKLKALLESFKKVDGLIKTGQTSVEIVREIRAKLSGH